MLDLGLEQVPFVVPRPIHVLCNENLDPLVIDLVFIPPNQILLLAMSIKMDLYGESDYYLIFFLILIFSNPCSLKKFSIPAEHVTFTKLILKLIKDTCPDPQAALDTPDAINSALQIIGDAVKSSWDMYARPVSIMSRFC